MKTISLSDAFAILDSASAVVVDNVVTYPGLSELSGDPDAEFMHLSWTDEEGMEFSMTFKEEGNSTVRVADRDACLLNGDDVGSLIPDAHKRILPLLRNSPC